MSRTNCASALVISPSPSTSPFSSHGRDATSPASSCNMRAASAAPTSPSQSTSPRSPRGVGVSVDGGVEVAVFVGVLIGVSVGIGVFVKVAVFVGVKVGVGVIVGVGVCDGTGVNVSMHRVQSLGPFGGGPFSSSLPVVRSSRSFPAGTLGTLSGDAEAKVAATSTAAAASVARPIKRKATRRAGCIAIPILCPLT